MGKLIFGLALMAGLFVFALNTSFISQNALQWATDHPTNPDAPKAIFWSGWWCDVMGDNDDASKMYWQLYKQYPQENALVAEALYHLAEIKADGPSRTNCLEYCQIILNQYPSEEKWRIKASKLYEMVKNNVR